LLRKNAAGGPETPACIDRSRAALLRNSGRNAFARVLSAADDDCKHTVNATRFAVVYDFTCAFVWSDAPYHIVADCMTANLPLWRAYEAERRTSTLLLLPHALEHFATLLLSRNGVLPTAHRRLPSVVDNSTCVLLDPGAELVFNARITRLWRDHVNTDEEWARVQFIPPDELRRNALSLRDWCLAAAVPQKLSPCPASSSSTAAARAGG